MGNKSVLVEIRAVMLIMTIISVVLNRMLCAVLMKFIAAQRVTLVGVGNVRPVLITR
jgi:hypothetical protein